MKRSSGFVQGKFRPINIGKYVGDPNTITFRSSWELILCRKFDGDERVLNWSSEEDVVLYRSPIDGQIHRYFIDFSIRSRIEGQGVKTIYIEVKPSKETVEPKRRSTESDASYAERVKVWLVNSAKWAAARQMAAERDAIFTIMTEKEIMPSQHSIPAYRKKTPRSKKNVIKRS